MISQGFDKALAGAKKEDMLPVMNLVSLLGTVGSTVDDGTLVLTAISLGACAGPALALTKLQTINPPGLKELLSTASKEIVGGLQDLKPQLAGDKRDAVAILAALGRLGMVAVTLNQKMMEYQQMPPFGGPPGGHSE